MSTQSLEALLHLPERAIRGMSMEAIADAHARIRAYAQARIADEQISKYTSSLQHKSLNKHLPRQSALFATVGLTVLGALLCSAAAQTATMTLPGYMRTIAAPLAAGAITFSAEHLARKVICQIQLTRQRQQTVAIHGLQGSNDNNMFMNTYLLSQRQLLYRVESTDWPILQAAVLLLLLGLEAGAAFALLWHEGIFLAIFSAILPPALIISLAMILTEAFDTPAHLKMMVREYEAYMQYRAFDNNLTTLGRAQLPAVETNNNGYYPSDVMH